MSLRPRRTEVTTMSDEQAVMNSTRPSLEKLTIDAGTTREELYNGFENRREIVLWLQKVCITTLGEVRYRFLYKMAKYMRSKPDSADNAVIEKLLVPEERTREFDDYTVQRFKSRLAVEYLEPAKHRALIKLRKDAGQYFSDEDTDHDVEMLRYIAMRPLIDQVHNRQRKVLNDCLDGLDDRAAIMKWADDLDMATNAEIPVPFLVACHEQPSAVWVLTSESTAAARSREVFAAWHLLPYFNAGIRDLAGVAHEQFDPHYERSEAPMA